VVEAPRFKLAFVLRQDLLIVDSLPPHQPQGFSRHHRALLTGITTALGAEADTELSDAMMLPWPMLASRTLDQGAEEARRAVQHKLRRTLESHRRITQVLLMGEAAAHWILGETAQLDTLQGRSFKLPSGLPVVVTLSLSELLRLPERKAEAWRDIQPLRLVRSSD
jgi:uracil-DNA glycosylase